MLENIPADNTFSDGNGNYESNVNGISNSTYEEVKLWDTCQLTEVWNKNNSMYFKVELLNTYLKDGSKVIIIKIAYMPAGFPAFQKQT